MQVCGLNVANIFAVGLLSALIGAGIAYFVLVKFSDFQWWWLLVFFGVQFVLVVTVAYALQKASGLNTMFCETPVLAVPNCDWSTLRTVPKRIFSDCALSTNNGIDTNSADWQDLLQQLDQMSNTPVAAETAVSDAGCVPAVATTITVQPPPPVEVPIFDFSSIASGLATPSPVISPISDKVATVSTSTSVATPTGTKVVTAPVESGGYQGIDFSAFFR